MSCNNAFPTREPFRPSQREVNMLNNMNTQLFIKNPYKRFPPHGVPCPEGPMTFQLAIRREKWWEMLEDLAWRERLMMERLENKREEQKKEQRISEEPKKEPWTQEDHQNERKDSAGIIVVDKDVAAKANKSDEVVAEKAVPTTSAVYDSSEEEEVEEEEEEEKEEGEVLEQSKEVKAKKKKGTVKEKDKAHKHEHKIRRVRPLHNTRSSVTGRKGSASSRCSTSQTTSHAGAGAEWEVQEV